MPFERYRTPGQYLRALIKSRRWNQRLLAMILGTSDELVGRMVRDVRPIEAEMAVRLGAVFDVPPEHFMDLQRAFDLAKAKLTVVVDPAQATRAALLGSLPIAEMITRGWLEGLTSLEDVPKVESALAQFFAVTRPEDIEILPHAAKRTDVTGEVTPPQLAWLYRVKQIASGMLTPVPYSPGLLRAALPKLSALLGAPEEARHVPRVLAECGIRFVVVESLTGAKIDGVCFWLNDVSPVIGMSLRFDRIDHFWFVLRHECEHVLRGHGSEPIAIDTELEKQRTDVTEEEQLANEAASAFCVPPHKMESFIARKAPLFTERDILGFANTLKIHPGLVAGQLQHRTGRYERFRKHLVKIRSSVSPSAVVDGWGDVAPIVQPLS